MKHNDTKNKLLFERLTNQYSDAEIEEGFFGDLMNRVKKSPRVSDAEEKLADLKRQFPAGEEVDWDGSVQDALKSQAEKLEQFAEQIVILLDQAGIEQSDQIYRDVVKSMETAQKAINRSQQNVEIDDDGTIDLEDIPVSDPESVKQQGETNK